MSNQTETIDRVRRCISDATQIPEGDIIMDSNFRDDLGVDSLDIIEIIMEIEDEFGVEISDEQAESIVTVGDVVRILNA